MNLIKNKFINLLIYSIIWFLFLEFIFENSYEVIDPCTSTPSTGFSNMIFLVPVILILLFLYLYHVAARELVKRKKIAFTIIVLLVLPLIFAWIDYKLLESDFMKNMITGSGLYDKTYGVDCYNDITVKSSALYLLNSIMIFIFSCASYEIIRK